METLKTYLDTMFADLPQSAEVLHAKAELYTMMEDKYEELKAQGKNEHEAIGAVISEFGDISEVKEALGIAGKGPQAEQKREETKKRGFAEELDAFGNAIGSVMDELGTELERAVNDIGGMVSSGMDAAARQFKSSTEKGPTMRATNVTEPGEIQVMPAFDTIEVDSRISEIIVAEGNDYTISFSKELDVNVGVEHGVLKINETTDRKAWFARGPVLFGFGNEGRIVITYPAGSKFERVSIKAQAGKVDVSHITARELEIDAFAGNFVMADTVIKDAQVRCKAGNVRVARAEFGTFHVGAAAGDITIDESTAKETTLQASAGNVRTNGGNLGKLEIKSSAGNIRIDRTGMSALSCVASVGNVKAQLSGAQDAYALDIHTTHGNIRCGGTSYEKEHKTQAAEGAETVPVEIASKIGNVKIDFT